MDNDREDGDVSERGFTLERSFEVEGCSPLELHMSENNELDEQTVSSEPYGFEPLG